MSEQALKRMFEAGFNVGRQTAYEGAEDMPVSYFYDAYVETTDLPVVGLTRRDNFRLREAEEHIAGAIQLLRVHQIHLTQILARVVKDEPPKEPNE